MTNGVPDRQVYQDPGLSRDRVHLRVLADCPGALRPHERGDPRGEAREGAEGSGGVDSEGEAGDEDVERGAQLWHTEVDEGAEGVTSAGASAQEQGPQGARLPAAPFRASTLLTTGTN